MNLRELLLENADEKYKDFSASLLPTVKKESIIGVRVPVLRKMAKRLSSDKEFVSQFLNSSHEYYEERLLRAFFIEQTKDYDRCIEMLCAFLPSVDNWAVCDSINPRILKDNKENLIEKISIWLKSEHTYTKRFAIKMLMNHFLKEDFKKEYLRLVIDAPKKNDYYINMMVAWYFAEALCYQYDDAISVLLEKKLPVWVHNKTISKATESLKIDKNTKTYLKTLKTKE